MIAKIKNIIFNFSINDVLFKIVSSIFSVRFLENSKKILFWNNSIIPMLIIWDWIDREKILMFWTSITKYTLTKKFETLSHYAVLKYQK